MNIIRIIEQLDVILYQGDLLLKDIRFLSQVNAKLSIQFNHYGGRSTLGI